MSDNDFSVSEEVRIAGRGVLDRLASDDAYRERFAADPVSVLGEAGIPKEVMPSLAAAATSVDPEVEGFQSKNLGPSRFTVACGGTTRGCYTDGCVSGVTLCQRGFWYG